MGNMKPAIQHNESLEKAARFDFVTAKKAAMITRAINHKLRQRMLGLLEENGQLVASEVYLKLRLDESAASQQLSILRRAGIVSTERSQQNHRHILYSLNHVRINEIMQCVNALVGASTQANNEV